jgi:hypothetical protein
MSANEYHLVTHWRVAGTAKEVSDVFGDPAELPRWWPFVYLVWLSVKSSTAARLSRQSSRVTESRRHFGFSGSVGDLEGTGVCTFVQDGRFVNKTYDWRRAGETAAAFSANHRWAMARGEESLVAELGRRAGA